MKIFVISLTRSLERRERIIETFSKLNLEFEFFDAIDGQTDNFKYSERSAPSRTKTRLGYHLTSNEVACFASHLSIWEHCIELNEPIWVFEDNIKPTTHFLSDMLFLNNLVEKYKFIKLFGIFPRQFTAVETFGDATEIGYYSKRTAGIQSYLLSPFAAKQFVEGADLFLEAVDDYMEKPWRHTILTYCFRPALVERAKIASTIGSVRKIKKNVNLFDKIIIELFRLYEQFRYKLCWASNSKK